MKYLIAFLFCLSSQAGLLVNSSSLNRPIATVVTDASVTPTTNTTVVSGGMNGVRVWTGEHDISEPSFDLWVRKNGGTAIKAQMYRWQGRIFTSTSGDSFSFGTTNGRTIYVTPMYGPATTETVTGTTGTANCDLAGPPIWSPTNAHVTLPANARSFKINSDGTEKNIFLSEFDGSAWTPARWVKLEAGRSSTVRTSYRKIALANYTGATLSITAPLGSTIGGTSNRMTLKFPAITGTTRNVTNIGQFYQAIYSAVSGDEIVLQDGTYAMTNGITHNTWTNNENSGNAGPEGIVIRGFSGNRDAVVITRSANTNGGWIMDLRNGSQKTNWFKDLTYDGACTSTTDAAAYGFRWNECNLTMQNVRVTGTNLLDSDGEACMYVRHLANNTTSHVAYLFCQFDNQSGRMLAFSGFQTNGPTGSGSTNWGTKRVIGCDVFTGGTTAAYDLVAGFYPIQLGIYGGSVYDAQQYVAVSGYNASMGFFFTSFPQAATTARSKNQVRLVSLYGCDWTTYAGELDPSGAGNPNQKENFTLFNTLRQINASGSTSPFGVFKTNVTVWHNKLVLLSGQGVIQNYSGGNWSWNIVTNGSFGIHSYFKIGTDTYPFVANGNTFDHCTTAIYSTNSLFTSGFTNNATSTSTAGITTDALGMTAITGNYNTFDPTTTGYIAGSQDTTNANAAFDAYYFPTASGNCDGTGDTNAVDYVGSSDPYGLVLIYKPTRVSRGAREIPAVYSGATLWPDVW